MQKNVELSDTGKAKKVTLCRAHNDQLVWSSSGPKLRVQFQGKSPFAELHYDVPAGGSLNPGPILGPSDTYPYTVTAVAKKMAMAAKASVGAAAAETSGPTYGLRSLAVPVVIVTD